MGWVIKRPSQGVAAEMLPKTPTQHIPAKHQRLTANKISVIEQLAYKKKAFIIVLQETHYTTADKLVIPYFSLAGSVLSRNHGLTTFVHEQLKWSLVDQSPDQTETEWLCVDVAGYKIINLYKPPRWRFTPRAIPTLPHPTLYVGEFNWQHVNWGYNKTSHDGESLDSWATAHNLGLLYDPRATTSVFSHRWNVKTNPDLVLESFGQDSRVPDRCVLGKFPRSQHRPSIITPTKTQGSCPQRSGKALELSQSWSVPLLPSHRWFQWKGATSGHIKYWEGIPGFLREPTIWAKQCIPRGRWKNCVPCCHKEFETLYSSFTRAPVETDSDRAALSLLSRHEQKKQERLEEAVNSIDFSHSSRKAGRTINKLTGRSGRSYRVCHVPANNIAL